MRLWRAFHVIFCFVGLVSALPIIGCGSRGKEVTLRPNDVKYKDFDTYGTPREFDGPGTVYRVDRKGRQYHVYDLPVKLPHPLPREDLVQASGSRTFTLGVLADLFNVGSPPLGLRFGADAKRVAVTSINLGEGYRARPDDGGQIDRLLAQASREKWFDFVPKNRYFVVRETVQVPQMHYSLAEWTNAYASFLAKFPQVQASGSTTQGSVGGSASQSAITVQTIGRTYSAPRNLFYLPDEVYPPTAGIASGPPAEPRRVPVSPEERPVITKRMEPRRASRQ
jgi:hypothetical protein